MQNSKPLAGKITVLGAGAWGTAVAMALAARHDVLLWGRNAQAMQDVAANRENRAYLPGFALPPALAVTADLNAAVAHAAAAPGGTPLLIAACPVAGLRPLLEQLKPACDAHRWLVVQQRALMDGFDPQRKIGLIVDDRRIDGRFPAGRLDFRR